MFSRSLIFAVIPLMASHFPQNSIFQQEFYTLTSKAEKLFAVVRVKHIRKYIPRYFLQEHPMADFDLVCLVIPEGFTAAFPGVPPLFVHLFTTPFKV